MTWVQWEENEKPERQSFTQLGFGEEDQSHGAQMHDRTLWYMFAKNLSRIPDQPQTFPSKLFLQNFTKHASSNALQEVPDFLCNYNPLHTFANCFQWTQDELTSPNALWESTLWIRLSAAASELIWAWELFSRTANLQTHNFKLLYEEDISSNWRNSGSSYCNHENGKYMNQHKCYC